ncbi:MAG: hypothetical protein ACP5OG_04490 [Candidatus Nanoarchaeia archaeon]
MLTKIKNNSKNKNNSLRKNLANEWFDSARKYIFSELPKYSGYAVALYYKDIKNEEILEIYSFNKKEDAQVFAKQHKNSSDIKYKRNSQKTTDSALELLYSQEE